MSTTEVVTWTIETGEPADGMNVRRATLLTNGRKVYSEIVYDTEPDGTRSAAQAQRNLLLMFGERLRTLLGEGE